MDLSSNTIELRAVEDPMRFQRATYYPITVASGINWDKFCSHRESFFIRHSYLACNISAFLFKTIQEVRIDVITAFFFLHQFYARMIEWQNVLVAVFRQINWITSEINRFKLSRIRRPQCTHGSQFSLSRETQAQLKMIWQPRGHQKSHKTLRHHRKQHYYLSKSPDNSTNLNGDVRDERHNRGIKVLCTTIGRNVVSHYPRASSE